MARGKKRQEEKGEVKSLSRVTSGERERVARFGGKEINARKINQGEITRVLPAWNNRRLENAGVLEVLNCNRVELMRWMRALAIIYLPPLARASP